MSTNPSDRTHLSNLVLECIYKKKESSINYIFPDERPGTPTYNLRLTNRAHIINIFVDTCASTAIGRTINMDCIATYVRMARVKTSSSLREWLHERMSTRMTDNNTTATLFLECIDTTIPMAEELLVQITGIFADSHLGLDAMSNIVGKLSANLNTPCVDSFIRNYITDDENNHVTTDLLYLSRMFSKVPRGIRIQIMHERRTAYYMFR